MPMRIPASFFLLGQRITVEWSDEVIENDDATGLALYRKNRIVIQRNTHGVNRPQDQIERTFCHELVHWLLFTAGEHDLRNNEKLVELLGALLHQALASAVYDISITDEEPRQGVAPAESWCGVANLNGLKG